MWAVLSPQSSDRYVICIGLESKRPNANISQQKFGRFSARNVSPSKCKKYAYTTFSIYVYVHYLKRDICPDGISCETELFFKMSLCTVYLLEAKMLSIFNIINFRRLRIEDEIAFAFNLQVY